MGRLPVAPSPAELRSRVAALGPDQETDATLREVARIVRRAVPFDDWMWLVYDPETVLPTATVGQGHDWDLQVAYCVNEQLHDDVNKFRALARSPLPVATLDQATGGARRDSRRYNELLQPYGMARELRAALVCDGLCWGSLTLLRASGADDFSAAEVALVAAVTDPVARRLREAVRRTEARRPRADPPGIVVVGPHGEIEHVTPAAEPWLRLLSGTAGELSGPGGEPAPGAPAPGDPAPLPVAALAVRARAGADRPDPLRLRVRTSDGGWVTVHAATDLDPPGSRRTTVILEPSRPSEMLPLLARAHRLTAREEQVVRLVLLGYATREISDELRISANTVQDHLKSVFAKTGVRSRRELAYQFALAYW